MKPPLGDRLALTLLFPSLAIPVAAIALAMWRGTNIDDGVEVIEVGAGLFYLMIATFLLVAAISMLINVVVYVTSPFARVHRAIPVRVLAPHYAVTASIAVWAVLYILVPMGGIGAAVFPVAIMMLSIVSFVRATELPRPMHQHAD